MTLADRPAGPVRRSKPKLTATVKGLKVVVSKLTDADVVTILAELAAGTTGAELARRFGVSRTTISDIRCGRTRVHVSRDGLTIPRHIPKGRAKLTEADIATISRELSQGVTVSALVRRFGVGVAVIERIRYQKSWKDATPSASKETSPP
jgi:transposase-like protein